MNNIALDKHPNFKYIIKNKRQNIDDWCWHSVIRNDNGYIWNNFALKFQQSPECAWKFSNTEVFNVAKTNGGKIFLRASAGEIEIFGKDFQ